MRLQTYIGDIEMRENFGYLDEGTENDYPETTDSNGIS